MVPQRGTSMTEVCQDAEIGVGSAELLDHLGRFQGSVLAHGDAEIPRAGLHRIRLRARGLRRAVHGRDLVAGPDEAPEDLLGEGRLSDEYDPHHVRRPARTAP
jgi:hypothetical protein